MRERKLRSIGAGLLLAGAAALGVQILISLAWVPDAVPFVLVVSGPQLVAGLWVLLPWGSRRAVRYLPAIILGVFVSYWNIAVLLETNLIPDVPQLVLGSLVVLLAIQAVLPLIAAGVLMWAWRVGRRRPLPAVPADELI